MQAHCPVNMPSAISSAAAFDRVLWARIGATIGTEARALWNEGVTNGLTFWSPNLNIARDPRWGRGQETPGEDPTVNAEYGAAFIRGFQTGQTDGKVRVREAPASATLMASACAKHYLGYTLDNCYGVKDNCRTNFNASISQQELEETHLPAFEAAVKEGEVSGLMCSYNSVNSVPSCANAWAMSTVARGAWAFDGYITSDCGAVKAVQSPYPTVHNWTTHGIGGVGHGYALSDHNLSSLASAGLDSNCNLGGGSIAGAAGGAGADARAAASHLLRVQMRVGLFDPLDAPSQRQWSALNATDVGSARNVQTALDAARDSIVLLENRAARLPLPRTQSGQQIAVIGPCSNAFSGGYSNGQHSASLDAAIRASGYTAGKVTAISGCDTPSCGTLPTLGDAEAAAAAADVVVLALGTDGSIEDENADGRAFEPWGIALPGQQASLAANVTAAAQHPVIVVVSGSGVDLSPLKSDARIGALLWIGYLGQMGGAAVADTLWGVANPSARLTTTFYPSSYIDAWAPGRDPYMAGVVSPPRNASYFDTHLLSNTTSGNPGRTHRFYGGATAYSFGDGLSYTRWQLSVQPAASVQASVPLSRVSEYATAAVAAHIFRRQSALDQPFRHLEMIISNVGVVAGRHSLLCYIVPPPGARQSRRGLPLRTLIDFAKTPLLLPNTSTVVAFQITAHDLTVVPPGGGRIALRGLWEVRIGNDRSPVETIEVS